MISKRITIPKNYVLDLEQASILAKAAEQCGSTVEIVMEDNIVNCRSILNILSLALRRDEVVELRCTGPTEEQDLPYMLNVIWHKLDNQSGEEVWK